MYYARTLQRLSTLGVLKMRISGSFKSEVSEREFSQWCYAVRLTTSKLSR